MNKFILVCVVLSTVFNGVSQVLIGNQSLINQQLPISTAHNYSYSQSIFHAEDVNFSGNITSMLFHKAGTNLLNSDDWVVYIGYTTKTSFADNADWTDITDLTEVFNGVVTQNSDGDVEVVFTTPFLYNGMANLMIAVDENTAGSSAETEDFYASGAATGQSLLYTSNSVNPNPATPPTADLANGGIKSALPNVTFMGPNSDCQAAFMDIYSQQFTTYIPSCWTEMEGVLGATTPILNASESDWDDSNFGNVGTNRAAQMNLSWTFHREWLLSPTFDLGFLTDYQIEFDIALTQTANSNSSTIDPDDLFAVVISTDNGVTWSNTNILQTWTAGNEPSNTGDHITIDLSAYTGEVKIGFYGESTASGNPKMFHIDNYLVSEKPSCNVPSEVVASNEAETAVDLSWNSGGATNVQFQYGATGFNLGEGELALGTASTHTLTGLTSGEEYQLYIRNICSIGDTSEWSSPVTFTTLCGALFTPSYVENFSPYVPNCWSEKQGTIGVATTTFTNPSTSAWSASVNYLNGTVGAASSILTSNYNKEWLISPSIDLGSTTAYELEFDLRLCNDYSGASEQFFFSPTDQFMIVISTDNGVTWNSANALQTWGAGTEPSLINESVIIDLSAYTGVVQFGFYMGRTDAATGVVRLNVDNFKIVPLSSCPKPTVVTTTNMQANQVDINWPTGGAANVEVEYGVTGFTPGTGTAIITTDNPYTITGLDQNTTYDVYLRDICAAGDTSLYSLVHQFTTSCDVYSIPFTEGFATWFPGCWSQGVGRLAATTTIFTATESSNWSQDGYGNVGTPNSAYCNMNAVTKNDWLITPSIDLGAAGNNELRFDVSMTYSNNSSPAAFHANDSVAVVISTNNGVTWNQSNILQVWTAGNEASNLGEYITIDLSAYTGIVKIGFYVASSFYANNGNVYFDNIEISPAPTCPKPVDLLASNISFNSVDMSWATGGASSVEIEYGPAGFTPGQGEKIITSLNPVTINGLLDDTNYDIYVRDICTVGDTSAYSLLTQITTTCGGYTPTYTQTFNSYLPFCWTESKVAFDGDITLTNTNNSFFTFDDYFYPNASGTGGVKCLFSTNYTEWLVSPSINLGTGTPYQLEFKVASSSSNSLYPGNLDYDDTLFVVISEDGGETWLQTNILKTWQSNNQPSFTGEYVAIDLSAYSGLIKIGFYVGSLAGYQTATIYLDDFKILPLESCITPVDIEVIALTDESATIAWEGGFTNSQIEYGPVGFELGSGTLITNSTDPFVITGLSDFTQYDFYARKICAVGDTSAWSMVSTFTTLCPTYSTPYYNDMSINQPYCWTEMRGNLGATSTSVEDPIESYWSTGWYGNVGGASISARSFISSTYHRDWLMSPSIALGVGNSYNLEFDINFTLSGAGGVGGADLQPDDTIAVVISTDNGVTWSQANILKTWDFYNQPSSATSQHISLDLSAYSGDVRFGFYNHSDVDNPTTIIVSIDNFEIADCGAPVGQSIDAISANSADVSWTQQTPNSTIEFGIQDYVLGSAGGTALTSSTGTATFTGLSSTTTYDYYIQNDCGGGVLSNWSGPFTFTTPCPEYIPTYTEDFTTYLPYCWEEKEGALGTVNTNFTNTTSTTWTYDGFGNVGSTGAAKVNFSGTGGDDWLISPTIDLGDGSIPYHVEFDVALTTWANTDGDVLQADDSLAFIISTDNGLTWSSANILKVFTAGSEPSNTGELIIKELQAYTGLVKFGFYMATTVTGGNTNMYIDNFSVKPIPSCQQPLDVTLDVITNITLDVSWTAGASHSYVEYGSPGFTPGTGTSLLSTTADAQITGLLANTAYDVYVMDSCGIGNVSLWSGPIGFTTECDVITPDHLEVFDVPLPDCWSKFQGALGTTSTVVTNPFTSAWTGDGFGNVTTTGAARLNIYSPASNGDRFEWLVSPAIDLGNGSTDYLLEFDVASTYYNNTTDANFDNDDSLAILISTDNGLTWIADNILQTWVSGSEPTNTGDHITISLLGYTGIIKLAYYGSTTGSGGNVNVYIDNFEINTCIPSTHSITEFACDSYTAPSGTVHTVSEVFNDTIINTMGCDSVITIDLTLEQNTTHSISATVCDEYISDAGNTYTTTGNYTELYTNSAGCDSVLTLNLNITSTNLNVTQINGVQLISNASGGVQRQWVDCNNGNQAIDGETNATFVATENGSYACEITNGSCVNLTDCYTVNNIGMNEVNQPVFTIYPNPATTELTIEVVNQYDNTRITLLAMDGKVVYSSALNGTQKTIDLPELSTGIYIVSLSNENGESRLLLTIE